MTTNGEEVQVHDNYKVLRWLLKHQWVNDGWWWEGKEDKEAWEEDKDWLEPEKINPQAISVDFPTLYRMDILELYLIRNLHVHSPST